MTRQQLLKKKQEARALQAQKREEILRQEEASRISPEEGAFILSLQAQGKQLQQYLKELQKKPITVVLRRSETGYFYEVRGSNPLYTHWKDIPISYIRDSNVIGIRGVHDKLRTV